VIWPPAIDPLAPKNMALAAEDAAYIVDQFGIDVRRPLLLQVSRFDPWKDPMGVIDAYRLVKRDRPDVQLALVGSMAHDDPEGWDFFTSTVAYADEDRDIYILSNLNNVGAVEVNAFQVHADVCIQKSIREGFGLTVSEALWKARPMVAGRAGGIVGQIEDGVTGYLVGSPEECARRSLAVLADRAAAQVMARRGKEVVRRRFLMPRLVRDWLALLHRLDGDGTAGELEVLRVGA
jgi:trehalose synthase